MTNEVDSEATETVVEQQETTEIEETQEDKPLGENGEKALRAEREARKAAEARLAEFEAKEKAAAKASLSELELARAETIEAQQERDQAVSELSVYKLAAKHGITDDDDLELLSAATDEATRERLAVRIAGTASTLKPDFSQGARGSVKKATTGQQFEDFFNSNLAN